MSDGPDLAGDTPEEEERRTGFLELFFDLVFVFAITQVVSLILEDTSVAGFLRATLVLGMIWWAWSAYTWMTNAVTIESVVTRLLFLGAMLASFFMALAVPDAYQDEGLWFAIAYFTVRLLQVGLYLWGLRGDPAYLRAFARLAPWFVLSPLIALTGAFTDGSTRTVLWTLSLAIDVAGTLTLGRENDFRISPAHFAERYALFVIIALGESIVAIGVSASGIPRDASFAVAVAVAFAGAAVLWWAHFDWTQIAAERRLRFEVPRRRGPLARDLYTFFHFPLVLGIIFYAVAAKKALAHPNDPLSDAGRWALGVGAAVYLSSFVLQRYRAIRRVAWERVAAGLAAVAAVAVLDELAAVALMAVVIGVVAAGIVAEALRVRELRARVRRDEPFVP
jgi:low temperature requirement protein LtrA